jgi:hypothetical protein
MEPEAEEAQSTLFDLSGKEFNAYWVDEKAPLFIANNALHWKAHKLQTLITRLEVQQQKNPAQFNSKTYIDALNEFERLIGEIKEKGLNGENLGSGNVAGERIPGATPVHGNLEPISMDS